MATLDSFNQSLSILNDVCQTIQDKTEQDKNFEPRAIVLLRTFPQYAARLESFSPMKWHSKPPTLSPPFCALYGWSMFDCDVLKCELCGELLLAQLPDRNSDNYASRLDRILTGLVTQHADLCKFRISHEPFEFFNRDDSTHLLKTRLMTFPDEVSLPRISPLISEDKMHSIRTYCKPYVANKDKLDEIITLAMNGWQYRVSDEFEEPCLECEDDVRIIPVR